MIGGKYRPKLDLATYYGPNLSDDEQLKRFIEENPEIEIYRAEFINQPASYYYNGITEELQAQAHDLTRQEIFSWLSNVTKTQMSELNEEIKKTIDNWATKNSLQPALLQIISV